MKRLRALITLVMLATMVTPSVAAICASTMHIDPAAVDSTDQPMGCHDEGSGPVQKEDPDHETCPMAALCALAGVSLLFCSHSTADPVPGGNAFLETPLIDSSLTHAPLFRPPIA